jgi:mono/diheme cytochrome c family protein
MKMKMKMKMKKIMSVGLAVVCLLRWGWAVTATQEVPASIWDGVFSDAQVQRGKNAYQGSCASCHGDDLVAVDPEAPSLTGPRFKAEWVGKTIGERFELARESMPLDNPGSLDDKTYVDILAFILHFNGYPSGDRELEADIDALSRVVIQKAEARPGGARPE